MEISTGLFVFGYIVSIVLTYIFTKRFMMIKGEVWLRGDRVMCLGVSIFGPITLVLVLLLSVIIDYIDNNGNKPAKW